MCGCTGKSKPPSRPALAISLRTALSDARIQAITEEAVALSYKDDRDHNRWKTLHLAGEELIRRFVQHVLPKGLMRIRHYGFLANRCRKAKLAQIRALLGRPKPQRHRQITSPGRKPGRARIAIEASCARSS